MLYHHRELTFRYHINTGDIHRSEDVGDSETRATQLDCFDRDITKSCDLVLVGGYHEIGDLLVVEHELLSVNRIGECTNRVD